MTDTDDLNQIPHISPKVEVKPLKSITVRIFRWILRLTAAFLAVSILSVFLLRWINPPTTSFMLQSQWGADEDFKLHYQWADWKDISPHIKMAAIASEDQSFAGHWGIDLKSIQKAIKEYERGHRLRGASTITQQVAKNLFLWSDQSYIRKGIEAYFAIFIELFWPKQRILEMYLNIVEFGDGVYGVQAAAERYFDTTAANLTKWQSAFMVTALPAPKRYNLDNPSEYMLERSAWVIRNMDLLGNSYYLEKLK